LAFYVYVEQLSHISTYVLIAQHAQNLITLVL